MRKIRVACAAIFALAAFAVDADCVFVEAERFDSPGGWTVDAQFIDEMGSPYLLAHGLGEPVADAETEIVVPNPGRYKVYARCYNWTSPWSDNPGPGGFRVIVDNVPLPEVVGNRGTAWEWQLAGDVELSDTVVSLALRDMEGFDGRCDALCLVSEEDAPSGDSDGIALLRMGGKSSGMPLDGGDYDLVVVGGGIAGMSAAVAAARLGCRVALLHNRPVLGGNNSSEVRVHLGGALEVGPYPRLGLMQKEFAPTVEGNANEAEYYEDDRKLKWVSSEPRVNLFLNFHVNEVETDSAGLIVSVTGSDIKTGIRLRFSALLFADCTGDGTVGFLAGGDFLIGREERAEYGEPSAPERADGMTMGASVQWRSRLLEKDDIPGFPVFRHGVEFTDSTCFRTEKGEWTWETGMYADQLKGFEQVRDYGMLVAYSNWSFLKNNLGLFPDRKLDWVAYVGGKRESRRLLGDYVLKEDDLVKRVFHEDGSFAASWSIDLHFPDPENVRLFPLGSFIAANSHVFIHPYAVPYRCLYSRNVGNLFMAGRDISCTHVALGTVRVMRTAGMMGEVVGMAAWLCTRDTLLPRDIYRYRLPELRGLMTAGVARGQLPYDQHYNEGTHLSD